MQSHHQRVNSNTLEVELIGMSKIWEASQLTFNEAQADSAHETLH